nr:hypothetical protein [Escherichia coli]
MQVEITAAGKFTGGQRIVDTVQPANTLNPITNQAQTDRDNGQDTAIQDAQHAANWASLKADDAQHAITVAQTDIDANKAAITDTRNDVSAVQSDVTNIKGDVAHAQSTADHANANANTQGDNVADGGAGLLDHAHQFLRTARRWRSGGNDWLRSWN